MNDPDRPGFSDQGAHVPELIDDYRRRREAWQAQARELARLQADVLSVAEREAAAIVASTRADIRQILVNSRRNLLALAEQVHALTAKQDLSASRTFESSPSDGRQADSSDFGSPIPMSDRFAAREDLLHARHEISNVLEEARPELDHLRDDALQLSAAARLDRELKRTDESDADSRFSAPAPAPQFDYARPSRFPTMLWVAALVLVGIAIVFGAVWWFMPEFFGIQRPPTQPSVVAPIGGTPSTRGSALPQASERSAPALPPPSTASPIAGALSVVVQARRPVWIRTTIDGYADERRLFAAEETNRIAASREVSLRVGDGGAVLVSVNGGKPQAVGREGEIVTRRFAIDDQPQPAGDRSIRPVDVKPSTTSGAEEPKPTGTVPAAAASAAVPELTNAAQRWLDAYYRKDAAGMNSMTSRDTKISDERAIDERLPPGLANARRTLEGMSIQFVGETAILTARMVEQANVAGRTPQYLSGISQLWIRENGQWRLLNVNIVGKRKLK